ncbi:hypothetical protein [Halalkalibacterium ligniniphilum]|uniref:hypothetical protein n=1 Tax=Halalkalibacterium ligniniphilum TaxID=1134413 RepID=UPI00126727C3|nr:hypothetical protein [Halalkalibacterium ligniniphilum]
MRKPLIYTILSLICAAGVFYLSYLFQEMAYWGNGLTWYWAGAVFTYLIGLLGVMFIILSSEGRKGDKEISLPILLSLLSGVTLVIGFLWTTFVIIAGMSGM